MITGLELIDMFIEKYEKALTIDPNCEFRTEYCNSRIEKAKTFITLAEEEGLVISQSPQSESFYAHKEEESIAWGYKTEGSYRFSDHWNWRSYGEVHCPASDIDYEEVAIGRFSNGKYEKVA